MLDLYRMPIRQSKLRYADLSFQREGNTPYVKLITAAFVYGDVPLALGLVRVLELEIDSSGDPLRCKTIKKEMGSGSNYETLSNSWGLKPQDRMSCWAKKCLWSLYIDQSNEIKHTSPISQMIRIYSNATVVRTYAGVELPNDAAAFATTRHINRNRPVMESPRGKMSPQKSNGIRYSHDVLGVLPEIVLQPLLDLSRGCGFLSSLGAVGPHQIP